MSPSGWQLAKLPAGMSLTKKETFELSHPSGTYDIELFTSLSGECWAIGVPRDDKRFIVYGSPVVDQPETAIEIVVNKINRETGLDDSLCGVEDEATEEDEVSEEDE